MPNHIENFGLEELTESEEKAAAFVAAIAQDCKPITGYYDLPYLNKNFGDPQFVLRTENNREKNCVEVIGLDTHCSGSCVWKARILDIDLNIKEADVLARRCAIGQKNDGSGLAVVNIINADVLPSFCEDDYVKLQMVAFPSTIEYFDCEDDYIAAQPESEDGKKLLLENGSVFPSGLLFNRHPNMLGKERDDRMDEQTQIRGEVKKLLHGKINLGEDSFNGFLRCIIDTNFGELEIVHTIEQVDDAQIKSIKVGAIVSGVFVLSGDAAIYEYEKGCIFDEAHDLALLRSVFLGGDAERIRTALAEDAVYASDASEKLHVGKDEIIARFKYVQENAKTGFFAHLATITEVLERESLAIADPGKRCIVLAYGKDTNLEQVAFIETNEEGKIYQINITMDNRYRFLIDEKPYRSGSIYGTKFPELVRKLILLRARHLGIIDDQEMDEDFVSDYDYTVDYKYNATEMIKTIPMVPQELTNSALQNIFGYLFAKAIEAKYSENSPAEKSENSLLVSYSPTDAWHGRIESQLEENKRQSLVEAMELGKLFYDDFLIAFPENFEKDADYDTGLLDALILVQNLGTQYMVRCLNE